MTRKSPGYTVLMEKGGRDKEKGEREGFLPEAGL